MLRRVGGHLEAHRGPSGQAALLPYEIAIIDELGLSVDEYREFQRLTAEYNGERNDDIAPVNNDPVTAIVVSLVVGVALSAAAAMMKPKPPKAPEEDSTRNLETGDNVGRSKFSPRYGFDSVQQLATLGKPVPLVFAHRARSGLALHETPTHNDPIVCGGIRVNTQLVWSQLLSMNSAQELRIAAIIGLARLGADPDYEGYAVGSTKLESFPEENIYISFNREGKRPVSNKGSQTFIYKEGQLPLPAGQPQDLLSTRIYGQSTDAGQWNLVTCSSHTPTSNQTFGCYNQMPNGTAWMLPFTGELIPVANEGDRQISTEETRNEIRMTLIKTNMYMFPYGGGFVRRNDSNAYKQGTFRVTKGDRIFYRLGDFYFDKNQFNNQSSDEINDFIVAKQEEIDELLQVGDTYQIGNFQARLTDRPSEPMEGQLSSYRDYTFEAIEPGQYTVMKGFDEDNDVNEKFKVPGYEGVSIGNIDQLGGAQRGDAYNRPETGNNSSPACSLLSRVDHGLVSNTRKCNATEIGIKSNVWRRLQIPNLNSFPDLDATNALELAGKNVILGQMSRYVKRYSFFKIMYRKAGFGNNPNSSGNKWAHLHGGVKFAVKGTMPVDQYNFIRISHPPGVEDAYEYKVVPIPGYYVYNDMIADSQTREQVWLMDGSSRVSLGSYGSIQVAPGFKIAFSGIATQLTEEDVKIKELILGPLSAKGRTGQVLGLSKYDNGREIRPSWAKTGERYTDPSQRTVIINGQPSADFSIPRNKVVSKYQNGKYRWYWYWDDRIVGEKESRNSSPKDTWYVQKDGSRYTIGDQTTEGRPAPPGIRRYRILQYQQVGKPIPNVETDKGPINNDKLSGRGLTIRVFAYNDPFDDNDQEKDAAFWQIQDRGSGYRNGETAEFMIRGELHRIKLQTTGEAGTTNYVPFAGLADYPQYEGEELSCDNGPEHSITYINEMIYKNGNEATYENLAYCTMRMRAGRSMTQFSQLSAYIKDGLEVERLVPDGVLNEVIGPNYKPQSTDVIPWGQRYSTCYFPEIAYCLLTDPDIGVGELVGRYQVNRFAMTQAAIFCARNGFTWNGVVAERINLREWIYQQASHNLLDFTVKGGQFSLTPALPVNSRGELQLAATPNFRALFTDGNMRDLQVSFLEPAERALFTAVVMYREEEGNGFPQTRTITVSLAQRQSNKGYQGGNIDRDVVETFDLSDSVTTESHCLYFAKMALRARQCIDHTIEFKTVVSEMADIEPGDYIRVASQASHGNRWNNGSVGPSGQVTSTDTWDGTREVLYWKPEFEGVRTANLTVTNGITSNAALRGSVFTIKKSSEEVRCYKITSISYGEEGEVVVQAAHSPLTYKYTSSGSLMLADWDEDDFIIETST